MADIVGEAVEGMLRLSCILSLLSLLRSPFNIKKITLYLTGTAASEDSKLGSGCGGSLLCCTVLHCDGLNDCTLELPACAIFFSLALSLSKLIYFQLLVTLPSCPVGYLKS